MCLLIEIYSEIIIEFSRKTISMINMMNQFICLCLFMLFHWQEKFVNEKKKIVLTLFSYSN